MAPALIPTITTSERSALNRCPQMWWWRFREGLTPKHDNADARWFGIGVHLALAEWYGHGKKRGRHPAETFSEWHGDEITYIKAAYAEKDAEWYDEPKYEDARELGISMLEHYIKTYGNDSQWNVLAVEQPFRIKVNDKGKPVAYFNSTFDLVAQDEVDGQIYLWDHKTAGQISTAYLEMDPQAGAYWAVATNIGWDKGWLKSHENISGILFNFLRKSKEDPRPRNAGGAYLNMDGSISKKQPPDPFLRHMVERNLGERRMELQAIADEATFMNAMRDGSQPVRKHRTRDCAWCDFFLMCKMHQQGGNNWQEFRDAEYLVTDPYARYRDKSASE
jgi:hypothetical protein